MDKLEIKILNELKKEKLNKVEGETGAACFKSNGFAYCQNGITKEIANKIAVRLNVSVAFYGSKACTEIQCKP